MDVCFDEPWVALAVSPLGLFRRAMVLGKMTHEAQTALIPEAGTLKIKKKSGHAVPYPPKNVEKKSKVGFNCCSSVAAVQ